MLLKLKLKLKLLTRKETQEEIKATEKEPKKESAMIAARNGNRLLLPLTTFEIWAAVMLFMLNSCIRYTIRFAMIPAEASDDPVAAPVQEHANVMKIDSKK